MPRSKAVQAHCELPLAIASKIWSLPVAGGEGRARGGRVPTVAYRADEGLPFARPLAQARGTAATVDVARAGPVA